MTKQVLYGQYDTYVEARDTVLELEAAGVPASDISLLAADGDNSYAPPVGRAINEETVPSDAATMGAALGGGAGLIAGLGILALPGVAMLVGAGWLATVAVSILAGAGAGAATGGLIDVFSMTGASDEQAAAMAAGLKAGGAVVSVRVAGPEIAAIDAILRKRASGDPAARDRDYVDGGWGSFDPHRPPDVGSEGEAAHRRA